MKFFHSLTFLRHGTSQQNLVQNRLWNDLISLISDWKCSKLRSGFAHKHGVVKLRALIEQMLSFERLVCLALWEVFAEPLCGPTKPTHPRYYSGEFPAEVKAESLTCHLHVPRILRIAAAGVRRLFDGGVSAVHPRDNCWLNRSPFPSTVPEWTCEGN